MNGGAMPFTPDLTPAGACHGPCNNHNRRAAQAHREAIDRHADEVDAWYRAGGHGTPPPEPEPPALRWIPGDPLFCTRCTAATRRTLGELDQLAAQVAATSDGYRTPEQAGRVTGSKTTPSVSPLGEILDKLLGDLFEIEDTWRRLRGYAPRPAFKGRGAHPRSRTIAWIAEHLDGILAHPGMTWVPGKLLAWGRVLRRLAKDDPLTVLSPIRCPSPTCGERRIRWDEERGYYVCGACQRILYEHEHDEYAREQAAALEAGRG